MSGDRAICVHVVFQRTTYDRFLLLALWLFLPNKQEHFLIEVGSPWTSQPLYMMNMHGTMFSMPEGIICNCCRSCKDWRILHLPDLLQIAASFDKGGVMIGCQEGGYRWLPNWPGPPLARCPIPTAGNHPFYYKHLMKFEGFQEATDSLVHDLRHRPWTRSFGRGAFGGEPCNRYSWNHSHILIRWARLPSLALLSRSRRWNAC